MKLTQKIKGTVYEIEFDTELLEEDYINFYNSICENVFEESEISKTDLEREMILKEIMMKEVLQEYIERFNEEIKVSNFKIEDYKKRIKE